MRLPRRIALRMVLFDRLETWRTAHITLGVFALLPFWWHVEVGPASRLEVALKVMVLVLVASGLLGTIINDCCLRRCVKSPTRRFAFKTWTRIISALRRAEEAVLGHSEELVHAYLRHVRPLLTGTQPKRKMLWATMTGADPAPALCMSARAASAGLGNDAKVSRSWSVLRSGKSASSKTVHLRLGVIWLRFHMGFALIVGILVTFHVIGVLYFAGI